MSQSDPGGSQTPSPPSRGSAPATPIDLEALADRVYRMLLAELRLEQVRSGIPRGRRK